MIERATHDTTPQVQLRKAWLVNQIEAIGRLSQNFDWKTLKKEIFDPRVQYLEKLLLLEVKKSPLQTEKIYTLHGRLIEASKYNLDTLVETFKVELKGLKQSINDENH